MYSLSFTHLSCTPSSSNPLIHTLPFTPTYAQVLLNLMVRLGEHGPKPDEAEDSHTHTHTYTHTHTHTYIYIYIYI